MQQRDTTSSVLFIIIIRFKPYKGSERSSCSSSPLGVVSPCRPAEPCVCLTVSPVIETFEHDGKLNLSDQPCDSKTTLNITHI